MAIIQVNFLSQTLKRTVPIQVVLPSDKVLSYTGHMSESKPYKTLYLLHGLLGNCTDWVMNTNIQRLAEDRNLAVVMPSGENSFYVNQILPNNDFGEYIGRELVEMTRRMFPLSHKREDTFIAGLSMGGFGALRNGLKYHKTFGYIAVLSGALQIFEMSPEAPGHDLFHEDAVFGDLSQAGQTDKNPRVAFQQMVKALQGNTAAYPKMYMACGEQDGLLAVNQKMYDFLRQGGIDVRWYQGPGGHDWDFWREQIKCVLDWLPLEKAVSGLNSGNVRN